jgi:hypothetical protein
MTDNSNKPQKLKVSKRKQEFLEQTRVHSVNEAGGVVSKDLDSDSLAKVYDKFSKTYRPSVKIKRPDQFAFFGSAQQYYHDASHNIINYYPFDGTREEVIEWHRSGSVVDLSLYKQFWPNSVGNFEGNYSQYVQFYSGPNKIPEAEFVGKATHKQTGLRIDPVKGNTIEFWMKKDGFNKDLNPVETIFDIGSYPGKLSTTTSAQIKMYLSASSGSPFRLTYDVGSSGSANLRIGSSTLTTSSVGDSKWHHYAFKIWHSDSTLYIKTYVDGQVDSSQTVSAGPMPVVDSYMGGTIAAAHGSASGDFSGSIDNFRFWKGSRSSKQITRFFDKKIYASDHSNIEYDNRLGLSYRFNKAPVGVPTADSLVIDHSGNDVVGRIKNYTTTSRVPTSAITLSEYSQNTEPGDPILDYAHTDVQTLTKELKSLGETHDSENQSMLRRFVPEWAREGMQESSTATEFEVLLHLMSSEFDEIKIFLDSTRTDLIPNYQETNQIITIEDINSTGSINYSNNIFIGCTDTDIDNAVTNGFKAGRSEQAATNIGLIYASFFQKADNITDSVEAITENLRHTETMTEVRQAFAQRCAVEADNLMKRKGTYSSIKSVYSISGIDSTDLTDMFLRPNSEIYLNKEKEEEYISRINSLNFVHNTEATLFMSSSLSDESTFIPNDSGSTNTEYTFEGSFLFPALEVSEFQSTKCSLFGIREVSETKNDTTVTTPDRANITVFSEKKSLDSEKSRFVLESNSSLVTSSISSPYINKVYDNSRWNIGVRVVKSTSEPFIDLDEESYQLVFSGYNYLLDTLVNSFSITSPISKTKYEQFNESNKTVFLGANRTNVTGAVLNKSDAGILNFSAWNSSLTSEELQQRSKNPLTYGTNRPHYDSDKSGNHCHSSIIFRTQFAAVDPPIDATPFLVLDETSGSADRISSDGATSGQKYNFKSMGFTAKFPKIVQEEHIPIVRTTPVASFKGVDEIEIKNAAHEKLNLASRSEARIFSFEKSVYQAISRDMYDFLAGAKAYNNIIGEPVNKYRREYKLLNHLREDYFSSVLNDVDFERYVSYYRWMDSAIGVLLEQMIPASSFSNVGIENVVESHALERNKYDHKYNRLERKEPNLEARLLSINELLYDWEHGHYSSDEDKNCLWQSDRKEQSAERDPLQKVLTTKVTGSTYVLRNLTKPYKHAVDRQDFIVLGHNRKANKIEDLYKIINTGKEITVKSDDIYEFRKCDDVINPQKEKIYVAKINTSDVDNYLDGDADLMLPFTFYSSSAGYDVSNFKHNLKITNNLEIPTSIQSILPRNLAGGMPHRNVAVGITSSSERPEAYFISATPTLLTIKQSPGPKSMFHKGLPGSKLYHMGNVKTTISPLVIGNYKKDYEIVMTNGRTLNNNHLVENEGAGLTGALNKSEYISGSTNFKVPTRTKREHVIVNRFSAPGSPESSAPFGMDREAEEYSIYDTINYRNSLVRNVYNILSTERAEKFGFRSGSSAQLSIHKTNRNLRRFTGSIHTTVSSDNYFVQHQIPHHDFGYSWITASANESVYEFLNKNGNIEFQHNFDISGSVKSSQTISFLSASDLGTSNTFNVAGIMPPKDTISGAPASTLPGWHGVDFVGTNYLIFEPVTSSSNHLGYPKLQGDFYPFYYNPSYTPIGSAHGKRAKGTYILNALINNRQGPYGWPTWKQIRGGNHPIIMHHRKENTMSAVFRGDSPFPSVYPGVEFDYSRTVVDNNTKTKPRIVKNYKEIMATCKFNPITVSMHTYNTEGGIEFLSDGPLPRHLSQRSLAAMWFNDEFAHEFIIKLQGKMNTILLPSLSMRAPAQNIVTGFANQEMADDIRFKEKPFLECGNLQIINDFIRENDRNPNATYLEINYIETVYPREINTFTKHARTRELFDFFGWKSKSSERNLILTGNMNYGNFVFTDAQRKYFLKPTTVSSEREFMNSYYDSYEHIDLNTTGTAASVESSRFVTSSKWVLDSRSSFTSKPTNITSSYFVDGFSFMSTREQGTKGEGILQNDYSIFPLGINTLRGAPPFAPVYNRRIPQESGNDVYLSGESKWDITSSAPLGPFYNKYDDFAEEARLVGQEYSLLPEFRISQYIEDVYASGNFSRHDPPIIGDDFLQLTGAVYHSSSGEISIGKQFFKTYSNSDFMKYFQPFRDNLDNNDFDISSGRITMRCSAVKRLLPYRGFYPAERAVQLTEVFDRGYMPTGSYELDYIQNSALTQQQSEDSIRLKIENAKSQVSKPLFAPGVLFNSIKTGLAVDYPIFSSSVDQYKKHMKDSGKYTGSVNFSYYGTSITDDETFDNSNLVVYTNSGKTAGKIYSFQNDNTGSSGALIAGGASPTILVDVDDRLALIDIVSQLQHAIGSENGHNGEITSSYSEKTKILTLQQTRFGPTTEFLSGTGTGFINRVTYTGFGGTGNSVSTPVTSFTDFSFGETTCYTGSLINDTVDTGIPRLTGSAERRIDFDDLLQPERLFGQTIYENEPHPSASLLYGDRQFLRVVDHAPKFGSLESTNTSENNATSFTQNFSTQRDSLRAYRSAANNFTSETVKFFLEGERLQSIISAPAKPRLEASTVYKMRVYVHNRDTMMYDRHSAFGPPVDEGDVTMTSHVLTNGTPASGSINLSDDRFDDFSYLGNNELLDDMLIFFEDSSMSKAGHIYHFDTTDNASKQTGAAFTLSSPSWAVDAKGVYVQVKDMFTRTAVAAELLQAITGATGHNGAISGSYNSGTESLDLVNSSAGTPDYPYILATCTGGECGTRLIAVPFDGGIEAVDEEFLTTTTTTTADSHGYLPYVAPYLDPNTAPYAEITFTPTTTKEYTIPEIIDDMSVTYYNMPSPSNPTANSNYKEAMVLSASVEFDKTVLLYTDNFVLPPGGDSQRVPVHDGSSLHRWVIRPKWETPVLDFGDTKSSALNLSNNQESKVSNSPWKNRFQTSYYEMTNQSSTPYLTASTGMWHQDGNLRTEAPHKGYFLTVVGAREDPKNSFGNLAAEVGFLDTVQSPSMTYGTAESQPFKAVKLGRVAETKIISEAVIAIPYYLTDDCDMKFFPMKEGLYDFAQQINKREREEYVQALRGATGAREIENIKEQYEKFHESVGMETADCASYQLRMMDKYILPPQFDFVRNKSVDPHVAYIFQFKAELSADDLSDIWQNVYPRSGKGISVTQHSKPTRDDVTTDVEYVTHLLAPGSAPFLKGKHSVFDSPEDFLEKDVRWLVFKIKYRAESHYSNVVNDSISEIEENVVEYSGVRKYEDKMVTHIQTSDTDKKIFSDYSYNWPYDYFSMIEMVKLESKVDFLSHATGQPGGVAASSPGTSVDTTQEITIADTGATAATALSTALDSIVSRQEIKSDTDSLPSSPNRFPVSVPEGATIRTNSETIYVNGVLQAPGSSDDYVMSGNTIVFSYNLDSNDKVHASYIKE